MAPDQPTFDMAAEQLLRDNLDPAHLMDAIQEDETIVDRERYAELWDVFKNGDAYRAWQRRCRVIASLRPG